jgi:hypothetical protein
MGTIVKPYPRGANRRWVEDEAGRTKKLPPKDAGDTPSV